MRWYAPLKPFELVLGILPAAYNISSDYNISLGEVEFVMAVPTKANVSVFGNVCEEYGDEPCPFVVRQGTDNLRRRLLWGVYQAE